MEFKKLGGRRHARYMYHHRWLQERDNNQQYSARALTSKINALSQERHLLESLVVWSLAHRPCTVNCLNFFRRRAWTDLSNLADSSGRSFKNGEAGALRGAYIPSMVTRHRYSPTASPITNAILLRFVIHAYGNCATRMNRSRGNKLSDMYIPAEPNEEV